MTVLEQEIGPIRMPPSNCSRRQGNASVASQAIYRRMDRPGRGTVSVCQNIASIASRYIAGELSASEVEEWADLIECRDDVGFGSDDLKETVHRLANQAIDGALTRAMAKAIVDHYDGTV